MTGERVNKQDSFKGESETELWAFSLRWKPLMRFEQNCDMILSRQEFTGCCMDQSTERGKGDSQVPKRLQLQSRGEVRRVIKAGWTIRWGRIKEKCII